jgi:uncharacterized protein YdaT
LAINPSKIPSHSLDWGNIDKYGEHIIINVGKPIEVCEYMNEYEENQPVAINSLRDRLREGLSNVTLDIASEKNYDCFETATIATNAAMVEKMKLPNTEKYRFIARQKTAQQLLEMEKNKPEAVDKLNEICKEYRENLRKLNVPSWLLDKNLKISSLLFESLLLVVTFPFFIIGLVLNDYLCSLPILS